MKRLTVLLLALLCLLLAGCADQAEQENSPASETPLSTPEPTPEALRFPDGSTRDRNAESLDLSWLRHEDVEEAAALLGQMPRLKTVELGTDSALNREEAAQSAPAAEETPERLSWTDIRTLQQAAPQAEFFYRFRFCGKDFSLQDEAMDLNHRAMDDEGAAVREILPCMTHCRYLDMDSCGVSNEAMAAIRDDFPQIDVVWRIWFGRNDWLSVRTDVERIVASDGGFHLEDNVEPLKYCTRVKYLDVGHAPYLQDWSFLAYMPELEVCIVSLGGWEGDALSGLANCPHLEYLEMSSRTSRGEIDLSFLAGLRELKHLNICCLYDNVVGYEALENLTQLERLWIGKFTYLPEAYVEHLREALPNTLIDAETESGFGGSWRWVREENGPMQPRYALLCSQFDYGNFDTVCALYKNDPLYYPHD